MARIDRKPSIETEPRTLDFRQIDIAREVALYVVHTRSREEACQIFTEGLEPVETPDSHSTGTKAKWGEYSDDDEDDYSYSSSDQGRMKEVLTAPF